MVKRTLVQRLRAQTGRYKRLCLILSGTVPDGNSEFSLLCTHLQIKANMLHIGLGLQIKSSEWVNLQIWNAWIMNTQFMHVHVCVYVFSYIRLFLIPRSVGCQAPLSWAFPGKNTEVGCHFLPSPGDLPNPGIGPESVMSPALAGWYCNTSVTWVSA